MTNIDGTKNFISKCKKAYGDDDRARFGKTQQDAIMVEPNNWTSSCYYCPLTTFECVADFVKHLKEHHCTKEGGSYVCRYGSNGVCPSLPLDGVSDRDYDNHVLKYHVNQQTREMVPEWSIFSAAQNLPAVLNDPSRGKQSNLFTKHWGVDFVEKVHIPASPHLPEITLTDFERYSNTIGKRYRKLEYLSMRQNIKEKYEQQGVDASHSLSNPSGGDIFVPEIFFKENLNLQKPNIFAKVFPGIMQSPNGEQQRQTGRLLQEQLSHYLDIIEVKIAQQVSQKSGAFFHAMTSQDAITNEMAEAIKKVKCLRQYLSIIHESIVVNAFNLLLHGQRRNNYQIVLDKLHLMATVHKTQPMLQLLLGTQDYVAALDLISTTQEVLSQELIGVQCFKHLPMQLNEMEKLIDKMLKTEFERYATTCLNKPLSKSNENHNKNNNNNNNIDTDNDVNDGDVKIVDMEDKLICILMGLLRKKNFIFIDIYKDESIVALRTTIKQLIIEFFSTKDMEVCLTGISGDEDNVAIHLTLGECITLLNRLTITLLSRLKRIKGVVQVMRRTTNMAANGPGIAIDINMNNTNNNDNDNCNHNGHKGNIYMSSNNSSTMNINDVDAVYLDENEKNFIHHKLEDLLCKVCSYCQERCSNLISKYNQCQTQSLNPNSNKNSQPIVASLEELTNLTQLVENFSKGCQEICDIMTSNPLKVAVQVQLSRFAHKFHMERKQKLSLQLDAERWCRVDVPKTFQKMLECINTNGFIGLPNLLYDEEFSSEVLTDGQSDGRVNSFILLDSKPYTLVGSALLLTQLICEYCSCAYNLPVVTSYLSHNVIDLLRLYNSRSCQLVMCGGALREAGLKTISAANLALVCKALELILWLLPKVKEHFKHLDPTSLAGYDAIEKDFSCHINEIENTICTILNDCINAQLDKWDGRPPIPSIAFRNMSRDLTKLKEAISSILTTEQMQNIYMVIHKNFKEKLRKQLRKLNIVNDGGPRHGAVTSELLFYMEKMRTLETLPADELNHDILENIWD